MCKKMVYSYTFRDIAGTQNIDLGLGKSVQISRDMLFDAATSYSETHVDKTFRLFLQVCEEAYCQKCAESNNMKMDIEDEWTHEEAWMLRDGDWLDE